MVKKAQEQGQQQISFCISGDSKKNGDTYTFGSKNTHYSSQLTVLGVQSK
jgi:1,4-dihydroxy-2-naphthoyl-CoA synthase